MEVSIHLRFLKAPFPYSRPPRDERKAETTGHDSFSLLPVTPKVFPWEGKYPVIRLEFWHRLHSWTKGKRCHTCRQTQSTTRKLMTTSEEEKFSWVDKRWSFSKIPINSFFRCSKVFCCYRLFMSCEFCVKIEIHIFVIWKILKTRLGIPRTT